MKRIVRFGTALMVTFVLLSAGLHVGGTAEASKGKGAKLDPHTPVSNTGWVGEAPSDLIEDEGYSLGFEGTGDQTEAFELDEPEFAVVLGAGSFASAPDEHGIMSIIGSDNRTRVTNTTSFPYRAIVHISSSIGGCTGFMISARTVATAGHCIHTGGSSGRWATNVVVAPGRNGSSYPYGTCTASNLYSVSGWTANRDTNYDYGAIQLNCTVGNSTGWIGYRYTTSSLNGTAENISGYPGDKTTGTQWQHADQIRNTLTYKLEYQNDTYGGQSGSPVYQASHSACGGSACAIAIHTNGGTTYNRGTRITQTVYNNLNNWK